MAIRIPCSRHLSSRACSNNTPVARRSAPLSVAAVLKQQQQPQQQKKGRKGDGFATKPSPLLTAEQVASRFGFDMAVEELERLFRRASVPGGHPPAEIGGSSGRRPLRVAYQGGRGSYCQEAAAEAFHSLSFDSVPCNNMEDAFSALEDFSADRAVIPAENSVDGPIDRNLDLLLRHEDVKIVGELVLPVNHCLLSLPGTRFSELRRIVSHPQALSHCKWQLEALDLDLEVGEVDSAADAAKYVAENRIADTAVIGSKMAAEEFGLQVLQQNFQDPTVNFNRFLQLGLGSRSGSEIRTDGTKKTAVAFSLENGVSDLFRAMWIFEVRGVRVTRVENRPNRANPIRVVEKESGKAMHLDYVIVLDLEGSGSDPKVKAALTGLTEIAGFVRVLGTYSSQCENTISRNS